MRHWGYKYWQYFSGIITKSTRFTIERFVDYCNIFTKQHGIELFSFLETAQYQVSIPDCSAALAKLQLTKNIGIEDFVYVTSLPCDGKSHYIKNKIGQILNCKQLHVSANENFTPLVVIQQWKPLQLKYVTKVAVHLNLSAFAPLSEVSRFLYTFLVFGYFWDVASGTMDYSPPGTKWHIFVEIPNVGVNLRKTIAEQSQVPNDTNHVINQLATLKYLAKHVEVNPDVPYTIDDEAALVCTFLFMHKRKELKVKHLDSAKSVILPSTAKAPILAETFGSTKCSTLGKSKFYQKMWVSLMHQRIKWLLEVSDAIKHGDSNLGVKEMYPLLTSLTWSDSDFFSTLIVIQDYSRCSFLRLQLCVQGPCAKILRHFHTLSYPVKVAQCLI